MCGVGHQMHHEPVAVVDRPTETLDRTLGRLQLTEQGPADAAKAKVTGAESTTAPVIVFMEPHCIANKQWVEPLLERLMASPKLVAVPVIDSLDEDNTNVYSYLQNPWGGFSWDTGFKWGGTIGSRNHSWRSCAQGGGQLSEISAGGRSRRLHVARHAARSGGTRA